MNRHKEGDLYGILVIGGKTFEIRYGYYSEEERELWEPIPIFPNFVKSPLYTDDGQPFVTTEQDICRLYKPKPEVSGENWCNDCTFYEHGEEIIGICKNKERKYNVRQNE